MSDAAPGRVLVLEDDPGISLLERRELERGGYEVATAATAIEAMEAVERQRPDLIILDYKLESGISGLAFYRELLERGYSLPAILVTGLTHENTIIEAMRAGVRDFIPKTPDYMDFIVPAVERVMTTVRYEQQKLESERLRKSEERFRTSVDNMLDCFGIFTAIRGDQGRIRDFQIEYLNAAARASLGKSDDALLGSTLSGLGEQRDQLLFNQYSAVAESGVSFSVESLEVPGDDEAGRRWFDVKVSRLGDGVAASWQDVTHRKQAELELKLAKQEAEAANRAKDRFLATLSHELRTPLTPVLAIVASLDGDESLTDQLREDIAIIRRNIELEGRLIDDLLDITRIVQGKVELRRRACDLHELIAHSIEISLTSAMKARGIELSCALEATEHRTMADTSRLTQVFCNLIHNAFKFSRTGGTIRLSTRNESAGRLVIRIADSGIGIDPQILERIFEPFEQGDRAITRQFGGLGLGLTISKAIVHLHQGELRARSDGPDQGSTFEVELPLVATVAEPAEPGPALVPAHEPTGSLRVLLVEDHSDTARVMIRLLVRMGHDIKHARTVAEALEIAAENPIDLLISDLDLPDGTGFDVMTQLAQRPGLRGIALSGFGMEEDVLRSKAAGFVRHLTKPVDPANLRAAIAEVARPVEPAS